jgi:hypothetical protein
VAIDRTDTVDATPTGQFPGHPDRGEALLFRASNVRQRWFNGRSV